MIEGKPDIYLHALELVHKYISVLASCYVSTSSKRLTLHLVHPNLTCPSRLLVTLGTSHSSALPLRAGCRGGPNWRV